MAKFTDLTVFSGSLTGTEITALVVNVSGTLTSEQATLSQIGSYVLTGNAASATKLATARSINGVAFDGTQDITLVATIPTASSITLGGVIIGSVGTTGINNVSGSISLANASSTQLGAVKIDNSTITLNGSNQIQYVLPTASNIVLGGVKPDGTIITNTSGAITVATASSSAYGVIKYDNTTLTLNASNQLQYLLPSASTTAYGAVKYDGTTITLNASSQLQYVLPASTASVLGGVIVQSVGTSGLVNTGGSIVLAQASSTQLGGVKVGNGINLAGDGTISVTTYVLPAATASVRGGVKVDGTTIVANGDVISASVSAATSSTLGGVTVAAQATSGLILGTGLSAGALSLATATSTTLGGVIIDNSTIVINAGTISVSVISATKIAIGSNAGSTGQGTNAVAIGAFAGQTNQSSNTIILNASGSAVNGILNQTSSFYVNPIRSNISSAFVYYNSTTYEVTYSTSLGYITGAGGTITQTGSRTSGVTIGKLTGQITLVAAAGSTTPTTFTVTNSTVSATDTIILNVSSSTNVYLTFVTAIASQSFNITFYTTGGTTSDSPVFNFTVIKGSNN
jgi:hypothetical protein